MPDPTGFLPALNRTLDILNTSSDRPWRLSHAAAAKHVVMTCVRYIVLALVLIGCSKHQGADDAFVSELVSAARLTLSALPETSRPGDRELSERIELIAAHATPAHVEAVRAGHLTQAALIDELHATLHRRAAGDHVEPPLLLSLLEKAQTPWSIAQALLFDALLNQYQEEAGLSRPKAGLDTGTH